ncbi:ABC transporter permease [uncultured Tistrella sp.]|uniref:ABC transporter permease n=1 Tax=Tistrella mobilis TaxID=171437 RepID=UPI000C09F7F6|nr:ABC transporter permease [uncultured Tistrella sp.]MAM75632.1 ABC transporter permease [Tistrella sp.]
MSAARASGGPAARVWQAVRLPLLTIITLAILWEGITRIFEVPASFFPPLSVVLADAASVWSYLLRSTGRTFLETVLGFLTGSAFGIFCGVVFAYSRNLERALFPLFVVSQTIPVIAFGALVIIWFGNTILSKVIIAFYVTFFPVTVNTHRGLLGCDPQKVALMKSFGAGEWTIFRKLRFPTALPVIAVALRLGISLSLIGAIVGEWFGDTVGLGVMLIQAMYTEAVPRLWAIILACGLLGSALYAVVSLFERKFIWWRQD